MKILDPELRKAALKVRVEADLVRQNEIQAARREVYGEDEE